MFGTYTSAVVSSLANGHSVNFSCYCSPLNELSLTLTNSKRTRIIRRKTSSLGSDKLSSSLHSFTPWSSPLLPHPQAFPLEWIPRLLGRSLSTISPSARNYHLKNPVGSSRFPTLPAAESCSRPLQKAPRTLTMKLSPTSLSTPTIP